MGQKRKNNGEFIYPRVVPNIKIIFFEFFCYYSIIKTILFRSWIWHSINIFVWLFLSIDYRGDFKKEDFREI